MCVLQFTLLLTLLRNIWYVVPSTFTLYLNKTCVIFQWGCLTLTSSDTFQSVSFYSFCLPPYFSPLSLFCHFLSLVLLFPLLSTPPLLFLSPFPYLLSSCRRSVSYRPSGQGRKDVQGLKSETAPCPNETRRTTMRRIGRNNSYGHQLFHKLFP